MSATNGQVRLVEPVPIHLDKDRHLLLTHRAIALAEREIAKFWGTKRASLFKIFGENEIARHDLICLLWAGLLHEDPSLTIEQVYALVEQASATAVMEAIGLAITEHFGTREKAATSKEGVHPDPMPVSSSGARPGPSDASLSG